MKLRTDKPLKMCVELDAELANLVKGAIFKGNYKSQADFLRHALITAAEAALSMSDIAAILEGPPEANEGLKRLLGGQDGR